MRRSAAFIRLFNDLDDYLRGIAGADRSRPFNWVVDRAAEVDRAVLAHRDQIKAYAQLRNAVVHYRNYPPEVVAEPSSEALREFRAVAQEVEAPKPLLSIASEVVAFPSTSLIAPALAYMRTNDFSQIAVSLEGVLRLLTTEGIARWLEHRAGQGNVNLRAVSLADVLEHETCSNVIFADCTRTIYDGAAFFSVGLPGAGGRIYAVVITDTGSARESPLGIVTPWDLIKVPGAPR